MIGKQRTLNIKTGHKVHSGLVDSCRGFTLLEVLAAIAILSIASVVVFQLFSENLKGISASEDYGYAVLMAEAKMRELLDDDELEESYWEDTEDGYSYLISISNVLEERTENLPLNLLAIDLTVSWSRGIRQKSLSLSTLKAVRKEI